MSNGHINGQGSSSRPAAVVPLHLRATASASSPASLPSTINNANVWSSGRTLRPQRAATPASGPVPASLSYQRNLTPTVPPTPTGPPPIPNGPLALLNEGSLAVQARYMGTQAMYSSYASRLRTGVATLMQPILTSTTGAGANPGVGGGVAPVLGKRRAALVSYTEGDAASDDDDDFDDISVGRDGEDDADDQTFGSRKRPETLLRERLMGRPSASERLSRAGTSTPTHKKEKKQEEEEMKSYLGERCPGEKIVWKSIVKQKRPYHPQEMIDQAARQKDLLIPIRLDIDTDTHRIRDCFMWNLNEILVTPQEFATLLVHDLDIPANPHIASIVSQITAQIEEYSGLVELEAGMHILEKKPEKKKPELVPGEKRVERRGRPPKKKRAVPVASEENEDGKEGDINGDAKMAEPPKPDPPKREPPKMESQLKEGVEIEPDCRIIVNLDVQISRHNLRDRIEWDLHSDLTPEAFALTLLEDLGLPTSSWPLISHAIHEELLKHKKDALEMGMLGPESGAWEGNGPLKRLEGGWRAWDEVDGFEPRLIEMSVDDIEKKEIERERASRRMRRDTAKFAQTSRYGARGPRYR